MWKRAVCFNLKRREKCFLDKIKKILQKSRWILSEINISNRWKCRWNLDQLVCVLDSKLSQYINHRGPPRLCLSRKQFEGQSFLNWRKYRKNVQWLVEKTRAWTASSRRSKNRYSNRLRENAIYKVFANKKEVSKQR